MQKAHPVDETTYVRSSLVCWFIATSNTTRRLPALWDDHCSARRLYRYAWRALSRRPYAHATCERRIDAKASSEDAVVDVEVDR